MAVRSSALGKLVRDLKRDDEDGLLVTPRIRQWLVEHSTVPMTDEMVETMVSIVTDTGNHDRSGRFGASSRGTCLRQQIFKFLGMESEPSFDPGLHNIFIDGQWRHLRWQMMGLHAGVFTHVETDFVVPRYRLKVSVDALNMREKWLFELKGAGTIPEEPPWAHVLQIHTYFLATGLRRASYLVEHKQRQTYQEWVIENDPKVLQIVKDELGELNESVETRTLPAVLPECQQKKGAYRSCPFSRTCTACTSWPDRRDWS